MGEMAEDSFRLEIQIMTSLSHPNILRVLGYQISQEYERIYMVTELKQCDLLKYLCMFGTPSVIQQQNFTAQLLSATKYFHGQSIIHRYEILCQLRIMLFYLHF